jgi:hypothetical protein
VENVIKRRKEIWTGNLKKNAERYHRSGWSIGTKNYFWRSFKKAGLLAEKKLDFNWFGSFLPRCKTERFNFVHFWRNFLTHFLRPFRGNFVFLHWRIRAVCVSQWQKQFKVTEANDSSAKIKTLKFVVAIRKTVSFAISAFGNDTLWQGTLFCRTCKIVRWIFL